MKWLLENSTQSHNSPQGDKRVMGGIVAETYMKNPKLQAWAKAWTASSGPGETQPAERAKIRVIGAGGEGPTKLGHGGGRMEGVPGVVGELILWKKRKGKRIGAKELASTAAVKVGVFPNLGMSACATKENATGAR